MCLPNRCKFTLIQYENDIFISLIYLMLRLLWTCAVARSIYAWFECNIQFFFFMNFIILSNTDYHGAMDVSAIVYFLLVLFIDIKYESSIWVLFCGNKNATHKIQFYFFFAFAFVGALCSILRCLILTIKHHLKVTTHKFDIIIVVKRKKKRKN